MEIASISHIKQRAHNLPAEEIQAIVLRLAKYKKENKELLSYLLFDAWNETEIYPAVKEEIDP